MEGVPGAQIMVPAAQVVVQTAPENARELFHKSGIKMCLALDVVHPVVQMMSLLDAFEVVM